MKPFNLVREGSAEVVAVACGACGRVYGLEHQHNIAVSCCDPKCSYCGGLPRKGWTICDSCQSAKEREAETARIAKAVRVAASDYVGPVYFDGAWNEGYLRDLDEFCDWWASSREETDMMPTEVWACTAHRIQLPSADDLVSQATEDSYEDAYDHLPPTGELQSAIAAYNASVTAEEWQVDYSRRVVLPVGRDDALKRAVPVTEGRDPGGEA